WGVHGVGGFLGIVMLGILATKAYNPAGADGLLAGNPTFFVRQCAAVLLSSVWAFVFTLGMLWLIDRVTPVKVKEADEQMGLDESLHGETAYVEAI
ncbi:MAG: ammonium transporter, partial [Candidatus Eisenbacteria bacterium]